MLHWGCLTLLAILLFLIGNLCIGKPCYSSKIIAHGAHMVVRTVLDSEEIFETKHWRVYLAHEQTYLGRCIIYAKRPVGDLAHLTQEELNDWLFMVQTIEEAIHKAFDTRLFNWGCLMNHAFRTKPYTPMVHWHMRPRYDHPVEFAGRTFIDAKFGEHYEESSNSRIPDDVRKKIIKEIQKHLPPS